MPVVGKPVNQDLLDRQLRHEIRSRRFSKGVILRIVALLEAANRAARERLAARLASDPDRGPWTTAQTEALVRELSNQLRQWRDAAESLAGEELTAFAAYEADWHASVINEASPIEFALNRPSPELLRSAVFAQPFQGRLLREWFSDMEAAQVRMISAAVREGVVQGRPIRSIARDVRDLGQISRRHAETIVRTAVTFIGDRARYETYQQNTDVLNGELFVATLDGRTTPQCRALDKTFYEVGKGPRPPLHPNCRSIRVPVTKSWEELGLDNLTPDAPLGQRPFVADKRRVQDIPKAERDRLIGQVPSTTSYNDWLKTQPRSFVEEVLGVRKAALYLDGKLSLEKFVDAELRPLTLEELRQREPAAWRRAGLETKGAA